MCSKCKKKKKRWKRWNQIKCKQNTASTINWEHEIKTNKPKQRQQQNDVLTTNLSYRAFRSDQLEMRLKP